MKKLLIKYGIPSVAITILGAMWMVGTTEFKDGKTFLVYWHEHTMTRSPTDIALNDKIELQEVVQHYQWRISEHEKKLKEIKAKILDPTDKLIELELWKTHHKNLQDNYQDWRGKAHTNRELTKQLLANHF